MGWMRANKLKLNPDKTEVLLVSWKANEGIEILPVLDRVTLPLKTLLLGCPLGFIPKLGCPGLGSGQEHICTAKAGAPAVPVS